MRCRRCSLRRRTRSEGGSLGFVHCSVRADELIALHICWRNWLCHVSSQHCELELTQQNFR
uniref:Uncharacterized protein n=1 Tax=Oryza brachyantha TaxID=4533 RepID=J3LBC6_ORYBR